MGVKQTVFWSLLASFALCAGTVYGADGCQGGWLRRSRRAAGLRVAGPRAAVICTQTVMVPQWVTETHKITSHRMYAGNPAAQFTVYALHPGDGQRRARVYGDGAGNRTRTETFQVSVPTVRNVTQQYQVCVPTYRNVQRNYTVSVPVWRQQQQQYTVMVPYTETRQATRQVCECVPVAETRTVCRDRGHWEQRAACQSACGGSCASGGCGGCGGCGGGCGGGVAAAGVLVCVLYERLGRETGQEQVQVTVMRPQVREVPYQYCVTLCRPETRAQTVSVCSYRNETRTCTEKVCDYHNEMRTRTVACPTATTRLARRKSAIRSAFRSGGLARSRWSTIGPWRRSGPSSTRSWFRTRWAGSLRPGLPHTEQVQCHLLRLRVLWRLPRLPRLPVIAARGASQAIAANVS